MLSATQWSSMAPGAGVVLIFARTSARRAGTLIITRAFVPAYCEEDDSGEWSASGRARQSRALRAKFEAISSAILAPD